MALVNGYFKVWATDTYSDKPIIEKVTLYQDWADQVLDTAITSLEKRNKHFIGQIVFYPLDGSPVIVRCMLSR